MNEFQAIHIKQAMLDWLNAYEVAVIKPGFSSSPDTDFLDGWVPNRVTAFDLAIRWAEAGRTVLYLSLDVSLRHKLSTYFCETLGIKIWEIKCGWLNKHMMERLAVCIRRLQSVRLVCVDPEDATPAALESLWRCSRELHSTECVAIDGLDSVLTPLNIGSKSRLSSTHELLSQLTEMQQSHGYAAGAFAM